MTAEGLVRRWACDWPIDLGATLRPLRRGGGDPAYRIVGDTTWRTSRTPDGPVTAALRVDASDGAVEATAWGPGSRWFLDRLPRALGAGDDPQGFAHDHLPAALRDTWRRKGVRWRVPASGRVMEVLVAAVIEQKVTGVEAWRGWRCLLDWHGEPAPGPAPDGMRVFPDASSLRQVPSWDWHRAGIDHARSSTVLRCAAVADRLEEVDGLPIDVALRRLRAVQGVGEWTAAETAQRALGAADAVSFGDFHLAHHVVYAMTGETDGDDDRMRVLMEPFAGHRYRVQRMVELSGITRPRRGPRMTIRDHRSI